MSGRNRVSSSWRKRKCGQRANNRHTTSLQTVGDLGRRKGGATVRTKCPEFGDAVDCYKPDKMSGINRPQKEPASKLSKAAQG